MQFRFDVLLLMIALAGSLFLARDGIAQHHLDHAGQAQSLRGLR